MKKVILSFTLIIVLLITIFISYEFIYLTFKNKAELENSISEIEKNEQSPFVIEKEAIFNSASAKNNVENKKFDENNWLFTLLQYTDIAIYIKPVDKKLSESNTVKNLSIDNIKIKTSDKLSKSDLYFLDAQNFGTDKFKESDLINENLTFTVLNDKNKDNIIKSNTPVFFSDCSNPITLKLVNVVDENFKLATNEMYSFNSKILDKYKDETNYDLSNLDYEISFDINLTSYSNVNYTYPVLITNNYSKLDFEKGYNLIVKTDFTFDKFIEK